MKKMLHLRKSINIDATFSTLTDEEISLVLSHIAKKASYPK